jgi:hypothetical protein
MQLTGQRPKSISMKGKNQEILVQTLAIYELGAGDKGIYCK